MSQSDQFDKHQNENDEINAVSDTYTTESSADIYNTPDISGSFLNDTPAEETNKTEDVVENVSFETMTDVAEAAPEDVTSEANVEESMSDWNPYSGQPLQNNNPYSNNPYNNSLYGGNPYGGQPAQNNSPYNNNPYGSNPYGGQPVQNDNPYSGQMQNDNLYGGQPAQNDNPYSGQMQNNNPYNGQPQNNNLYTGSQYISNPYANSPYGEQPAQNNNSYGSQTAQNGNQYGVPPYGNNQYSPYAAPPKKNNTGLIIGIVAAVVVLFLIAVGALVYKVVSLYTDERESRRNTREEYNFDDDWDQDRRRDEHDNDYDDDYGYDDNYDDYDDYGYDDYFNYDDDEYYTLHDDIKTDLSYTVDFEMYEYDTDYENVEIMVFYPIISDSDSSVPNLDKLNATIQSEIDFLVEYFEDEYEAYFDDSDSYFHATSTGYVTYMDEEKMSIVFSENVYSDYYYDAFLYSINIDMENGIILDNESMLNVDDDFSVEFREKSDIQNGEIEHLTRMSDQEITGHFDSSDIIVFYTPHGMEIGFNYDEGWVTVTYRDYEQYLKVF